MDKVIADESGKYLAKKTDASEIIQTMDARLSSAIATALPRNDYFSVQSVRRGLSYSTSV